MCIKLNQFLIGILFSFVIMVQCKSENNGESSNALLPLLFSSTASTSATTEETATEESGDEPDVIAVTPPPDDGADPDPKDPTPEPEPVVPTGYLSASTYKIHFLNESSASEEILILCNSSIDLDFTIEFEMETIPFQIDYEDESNILSCDGWSSSKKITITPNGYFEEPFYNLTIKAENIENELLDEKTIQIITGNEPRKTGSGSFHTTVLMTDGTVWSYGSSAAGQLGDGEPAESYKPVKVNYTTGSKIIKISSGPGHNLALKEDGTVLSWGYNGQGQLGDGTTNHSSSVVLVSNLINVIEVSAGGGYYYDSSHSLALDKSGNVWAWGDNGYGQLGNGNTSDAYTPSYVYDSSGSIFSKVIQIKACSNFSVALKEDGTVWSWGRYYSTSYKNPVQIVGVNGKGFLTKVVRIGCNMALIADGKMVTWGENTYGRLGNNTTYSSSYPVYVLDKTGTAKLSQVLEISGSYNHSSAIDEDGKIWTWGSNVYKQLGYSTSTTCNGEACSKLPVQPYKDKSVPNYLENVLDVATGSINTIMIQKSDGKASVMGVGSNSYGQLGIGLSSGLVEVALSPLDFDIMAPTLEIFEDIDSITGGIDFGIAQKTDGSIWSWGTNKHGQLGNNSKIHYEDGAIQSLEVSELSIQQVSAGWTHTLYLTTDGEVYSVGKNYYGELGNGTNTDSTSLVQVKGIDGEGFLSGVKKITAGINFNLAVLSDDTVVAWGQGDFGQLGNNDDHHSNVPVEVLSPDGKEPLSSITDVEAGDFSGYAITTDGIVYSWGGNMNGQLGNGKNGEINTYAIYLLPNKVRGPKGIGTMQNIKKLVASQYHVLALSNSGNVYSWGYNEYGQLGLGNSFVSPATATPFAVVSTSGAGELGNIIDVAISWDHSVALQDVDGDGLGEVLTWGENPSGQLGIASSGKYYFPQRAQYNGSPLGNVKQIAANGMFDNIYYKAYTLALTNEGKVLGFGYNALCVFGNAKRSNSNLPIQISQVAD